MQSGKGEIGERERDKGRKSEIGSRWRERSKHFTVSFDGYSAHTEINH